LLNKSNLHHNDPLGMHKVYDIWPQLAKESYESDLTPIDFKNIDHIVFAEMGGSGSICDLFSAILSKTKIHVDVVRGYILPKTVLENTKLTITDITSLVATNKIKFQDENSRNWFIRFFYYLFHNLSPTWIFILQHKIEEKEN